MDVDEVMEDTMDSMAIEGTLEETEEEAFVTHVVKKGATVFNALQLLVYHPRTRATVSRQNRVSYPNQKEVKWVLKF